MRNGKLLQYSCLENSMDGGAWQATAHCHKESEITEHTRCQNLEKSKFKFELYSNNFVTLWISHKLHMLQFFLQMGSECSSDYVLIRIK